MKCISWFKMYTRIIVTIPSFLQDLVYLLYQQTKDLRGDFSFKWIIKNTSNWHINDTNCVLFQTIGLDKIWFCKICKKINYMFTSDPPKDWTQGEGTKSEDVSFFDKKYIIFNSHSLWKKSMVMWGETEQNILYMYLLVL